jgi:hypothetical protein
MRADDEAISAPTDRLRSILATLEFARGERQADLREQARRAIADVKSARQRTLQQGAQAGNDESRAR